ncbi:uncharacterized protein LOC122537737 isoform X2 [Frieseomelitta varia]|uniref:uncharacterized protein LOC122537737 isoform X2 n=1 Tax=Frieseomelitta varia TaxID=561572 RepID=UPI001CB6A3D0|nr:uncharacterized protein LOC122537737 isoform X2 [Frieseomelitta varia]
MVSSPTNGKSLKSFQPKKVQDYTYNNESLSDDKISSVVGKKKKKTIRAQNAPANRKVNEKLSINDKISPIVEKEESKERTAIAKVLTQDDSASKKVDKKLSNKNKIFNFETNQTDIDLRKGYNENEEINKSPDLSKTPSKNNTLGNLENIDDIKTENIHLLETPRKNDVSRDLESTNIKIEDAETPIKSIINLGINSVEWHAQTEISTSKKKKRHLYDESTPKKKIKKDLSSDINDYDQLSDIPKKELCDNELNDFEHIEMLHDPNSLINFEENTIFCSTNEVVPNDENIEISRDSKSDPLYIINNDNTSIAENMENEGKNAGNKIKRKRKHRSSNTDTDSDVDYDTIKHVLGELELDISLEGEEDELTEEATKRLYNLKVKLIHKVPIQHKIEHTTGSKILTKKEKELFLKYASLKSGVFTPSEDKIIMDNWKKFCEVHDWNSKCVHPFIHMKYAGKFYIRSLEERQKFTQFLANGLPRRTLYSVLNRFKYLFGDHEKSFQRYTSAEDKTILSYINNKQNRKRSRRFSELSKILGRTSHSIWTRYQRLKRMHKNKERLPKITWSLFLIEKFIKTFMSVTLCDTIQDLKDAIIPKVVWQRLEKKIGINYNILRKFWIYKLHMQLFCPERIYLNDIKIKLIEYVYVKGISSNREIIWSKVAKYFDGITTAFLCRTFSNLVQEASQKINTKKFLEIMEYLYNEKIQAIKDDVTDKFLPRLSYNNGKVEIITEDLNEDLNTDIEY